MNSPLNRFSPVSGVATGTPVVARIPYLNAEPFYVSWSELPAATADLVPRRLGQEARSGGVDAGLLAVVDALSLAADFERLGNLGIACGGEVESVVLLAATPIEQLSQARIFLTTESSTSVELCRLLLERCYGLEDLRYERARFSNNSLDRNLPAEGEAWLVIGDAALLARRAHPGSVVLDLGSAWREWTGLPFVYAVWAARKTLPAEVRDSLLRFLDESLAAGEKNLADLARRYAAKEEGRLGSAAELKSYLERFVYRLGSEEEKGLAHFEKLMREHHREQ